MSQLGTKPLTLQMGQKTVNVVGLTTAGSSPVVSRVAPASVASPSAAPAGAAAASNPGVGLVPITDPNMPRIVVVSRQNQPDAASAGQ